MGAKRTRDEVKAFICTWTDVDPETGCWVWRRSLNPYGYSRLQWTDEAGVIWRGGHRVSYTVYVGPVPDGLVIDHLCRNRACLNPRHMEPVTTEVNKDRGDRSRTKNECVNGHEYTPENTYIHPTRHTRDCRECRREVDRRRQAERSHRADAPCVEPGCDRPAGRARGLCGGHYQKLRRQGALT